MKSGQACRPYRCRCDSLRNSRRKMHPLALTHLRLVTDWEREKRVKPEPMSMHSSALIWKTGQLKKGWWVAISMKHSSYLGRAATWVRGDEFF